MRPSSGSPAIDGSPTTLITPRGSLTPIEKYGTKPKGSAADAKKAIVLRGAQLSLRAPTQGQQYVFKLYPRAQADEEAPGTARAGAGGTGAGGGGAQYSAQYLRSLLLAGEDEHALSTWTAALMQHGAVLMPHRDAGDGGGAVPGADGVGVAVLGGGLTKLSGGLTKLSPYAYVSLAPFRSHVGRRPSSVPMAGLSAGLSDGLSDGTFIAPNGVVLMGAHDGADGSDGSGGRPRWRLGSLGHVAVFAPVKALGGTAQWGARNLGNLGSRLRGWRRDGRAPPNASPHSYSSVLAPTVSAETVSPKRHAVLVQASVVPPMLCRGESAASSGGSSSSAGGGTFLIGKLVSQRSVVPGAGAVPVAGAVPAAVGKRTSQRSGSFVMRSGSALPTSLQARAVQTRVVVPPLVPPLALRAATLVPPLPTHLATPLRNDPRLSGSSSKGGLPKLGRVGSPPQLHTIRSEDGRSPELGELRSEDGRSPELGESSVCSGELSYRSQLSERSEFGYSERSEFGSNSRDLPNLDRPPWLSSTRGGSSTDRMSLGGGLDRDHNVKMSALGHAFTRLCFSARAVQARADLATLLDFSQQVWMTIVSKREEVESERVRRPVLDKALEVLWEQATVWLERSQMAHSLALHAAIEPADEPKSGNQTGTQIRQMTLRLRGLKGERFSASFSDEISLLELLADAFEIRGTIALARRADREAQARDATSGGAAS